MTPDSKRIAELEAEVAALRKAEQLYQSIVFSNFDAVFALDTNGRFLFINPATEKLTGYTLAEVFEMSFHQICVPDQLERAIQGFREDLAGGHDEFETAIITKDGRRIELYVTGGPIMEKGKVTGIYGIASDITAQKQVEKELQTAAEQYRTLVDNSPIIIDRFDRDCRHLYVNTAGQKLHTKSESDLVGKTIAETGVPDPFRSQWEQRIKQVFQTGQPLDVEDAFPTSQGIGYFSSRCVPEFDEQKNVATVLVVSSDVTQRRQTEEALQESEAKYRKLHESMRDAFVVVDMNGRIQESNRIYQEMLGYSVEELRRLTYVDLTPAKWHAFEADIVAEQILPRGYSEVYEKEYRRKDGTVFPIELRTILIRDDAGQPKQMWAIIRDITERKQAETALRESEERVQLALGAAKMGAFDWDIVSGKAVWSPETERIWGLPVGGFDGTYEHWRRLVHPEDLPKAEALVRRAVEEPGTPYELEHRIIHPDGAVRWIFAKAITVRNASGQAIRMVGINMDITGRKEAEAVLRRSQKELEQLVSERTVALRDGEERFRQLATNIREVFYLEGVTQGDSLYISPAYETIWGRTLSSLNQNPTSWQESIHPDDRHRLKEIEATRLTTGYDIEYRIIRPDGSIRWIRDRGVPILNNEGKPYRVAGIAEDITLQRQLEQEIINVSHREQRRIGRDLHDGVCQLLIGAELTCEAMRTRFKRKSAAVTSADLAYLQSVIKEAVHQTRVVTQDLIPVELETGGLATAFKQLAESTTSLFRTSCSYTGPDRVFSIHNPMASLQLYRIAQEAVHNAVKHGKPRHVTIHFKVARNTITLTITDDGRGLPKTRRKKTGMGLQIMNYRARMINGNLTVEPNSPRGTIVTCSCPNTLPAR